jgi:hypothetical protein
MKKLRQDMPFHHLIVQTELPIPASQPDSRQRKYRVSSTASLACGFREKKRRGEQETWVWDIHFVYAICFQLRLVKPLGFPSLVLRIRRKGKPPNACHSRMTGFLKLKEKSIIIRASNALFHVDIEELGKEVDPLDLNGLHRRIILDCGRRLRVAVCHHLLEIRVAGLGVLLVVI